MSQEEEEQETYERRRAMAAIAEAHKKVNALELQRQQDLEWFREAMNTESLFGDFLFQLCVKAIPLTSVMSSTHDQASRQEKNSTRPKAGNVRTKLQPRFL